MTTATRPAGAAAGVYSHPFRVYWEDTDAGGVVFYANYLRFFERARTEWLRALGIAQQRLLDDTGVMFVVAEARLRWLKPARLDDLLDVSVAPRPPGRATLELDQQAWRGADLLAEAAVRIGCVDAGTFRARRIPKSVIERLP